MVLMYSLISGSSIRAFWSRSSLATIAPSRNSSLLVSTAEAGLPRSGRSEPEVCPVRSRGFVNAGALGDDERGATAGELAAGIGVDGGSAAKAMVFAVSKALT